MLSRSGYAHLLYMSVRPHKAVLERVPIVNVLPSLALLFHKSVDIAGTGKRKIDGSYEW